MRDISIKTSIILVLILFVAGVGVSGFLYDMRFSIPELFIPWEIKVAFAVAVFILAMFLYSDHKFELVAWFKTFIVILIFWGVLALANGLVFFSLLNDPKLLMLESLRNALFDFTPTFIFQVILAPFLAYPVLARSSSTKIAEDDDEDNPGNEDESNEMEEWTPPEDWALPEKDAFADTDIHPDLLFDEPSIEELGLLDSIKPQVNVDAFDSEPEIDLAELSRLDIDIEAEPELTESFSDADVSESEEVSEKEIIDKTASEPELTIPELEDSEDHDIDEEIAKLFESEDALLDELAVKPEFPQEIIESQPEPAQEIITISEPEIEPELEPETDKPEPKLETITELDEETEELSIVEIDAELERIAVEEIGVELDIPEIEPQIEEKDIITEPELEAEIPVDSTPEETPTQEIISELESKIIPQNQSEQSPTSDIESVAEAEISAEEEPDIVEIGVEEIEFVDIEEIEPERPPVIELNEIPVNEPKPKPKKTPELTAEVIPEPESISEFLKILDEIESESTNSPGIEPQIDIGDLNDLLDETVVKPPEIEPLHEPQPVPEPQSQSKPSRTKEPKIETISDFADDLIEDDLLDDLDPDLGELLKTLGVDLDEEKPKKQQGAAKAKPHSGKAEPATHGFGQKPKRDSETEKRKVDEEGLALILNELDGFGEPEFGKKPSKAEFSENDLKTAMEESEKKGVGKKAPQFQAGSGNLAKDPSDKIEISVRKIIKYNSSSESGAVLDKLIRKGSDHLLKIPLRMIIDQLPAGNVELTVDYIYNMVPIELVNFIAAQQGPDIMELTVRIPMEDIAPQVDPSLMESEGELNSDSTWIDGEEGKLPSFG